MVVRVVSDIGTSVFFFGGERYFSPPRIPFPSFSFAPSLDSSDLPFPWLESYRDAFRAYQQAALMNNKFTDEFFLGHISSPWDGRKNGAAFFGSADPIRQLVYNSAAQRPDLFDVSLATAPHHIWAPWNPASDEHAIPLNEAAKIRHSSQRNHPGFIQPVTKFIGSRPYKPHSYKYVVVMLGTEGLTTSGRLAHLLAYSGAVILLQASSFEYYFSAQLRPWVHYVPLTSSGADLIAKVEWLIAHDDLARQIAINSRNFGKSYLRLEDYYCYAAGALKHISDLMNGSNITKPFDPRLID